MDKLLNGNDTLGQEDGFFESLDELALDDMALEVGSYKANMDDMPNQHAEGGAPELDSTDVTETDDFWPDDDDSDASQSMDELLNKNDTPGKEDDFFESLDELALDEMALEIGSDKTDMEDMPNQHAEGGAPDLDSLGVDSMSSGGKTGYMAPFAGILSGAAFVKAQEFVVRKKSSLRNMAAENDVEGLDVLSEAVDVDDLQNAATSLGNTAYRASAESTRSGFGIVTSTPPAPSGVVESAA
jgi:hypothetical protein